MRLCVSKIKGVEDCAASAAFRRVEGLMGGCDIAQGGKATWDSCVENRGRGQTQESAGNGEAQQEDMLQCVAVSLWICVCY